MKKLLIFTLLLFSSSAFAQTGIGIETRATNDAYLLGIRYDIKLNDRLVLITNVSHYMDSEDEATFSNDPFTTRNVEYAGKARGYGGGLGAGLGLRYNDFLIKNLNLQSRVDIWSLSLNYYSGYQYTCEGWPCIETNLGSDVETIHDISVSRITRFQTTIGLSYVFNLNEKLRLTPSINIGLESNYGDDFNYDYNIILRRVEKLDLSSRMITTFGIQLWSRL